jgi:hypothetical protein
MDWQKIIQGQSKNKHEGQKVSATNLGFESKIIKRN